MSALTKCNFDPILLQKYSNSSIIITEPMFRDLPEPRHEPLPQAPVQLVVWQLQFAEPADIVPPAVGTTFQDRLAHDSGGPFQLQRLTGQTFAISFSEPGGQGLPQAEPAPIEGWSLRRGPLAVTLNRQSLSVETNAYETWASFRSVVDLAIQALGEAVLLPGEQRLGLRYVDRVVHPGVRKLDDWTDLLAPWLIGPLAHPHLRDAVGAYAQQVDFDAQADGIRATLRQRAFADAEQRGRQTVILDYDVFREGYRLIEADATLATTDEMHDLAHRLFEASITEPLYNAFTKEPEGA
jgi:uncharacterized protein (TIGR04255 family)